jgi:hypothetical protein
MEGIQEPTINASELAIASRRGFVEVGMPADMTTHVVFHEREKSAMRDDESANNPPVMAEHATISIPGSKDNITLKVTPEIQKRFALQYHAWKEGLESVGTPLEGWAALPGEGHLPFRLLNIYTVEQLAEASDAVVQRIGMGGLDLRRRAQQEVFSKTAGAHAKAATERADALQGELEEVKLQLAALMEAVQVDATKKAPARRRNMTEE